MPQKYFIKLVQKLFVKFVTPKFLQKKLKKTKNNQKFSSKKVLFNKWMKTKLYTILQKIKKIKYSYTNK